MDASEMVSEFVSLKRRIEAEGALPSPDLVRWEILRQGLLLAQTFPDHRHVSGSDPWVRLATPDGVVDLQVVGIDGVGCVVRGPVPVADGERPVVLLMPPGEDTPIATRAVAVGPALGEGRRYHFVLPYLTGAERTRFAAAPTRELEELAR